MADLKQVRVVWRDRIGERRAWMVEIDPTADFQHLLPDLVEALELTGDSDGYALSVEGSLNTPVLVISTRTGRSVGRATPIDHE